jgi:CRISPR-associated protein (TIGR03986 family)
MADKERKTAHAPYNFVPLPDRVVAAESIPDHDQYHADRHTGYFHVKLTTETPLYIRGMLTENEAVDKGRHKDKPGFFQLGGKPIIPGSSLRGMIRSLVEIITFGKMTRMSDKPKIFFRAVAAKSDDPLGEHYKRVTGQLGKNIRAGYLIRQGEEWFIRPASQYAESYFVKVKDDNSRVNGVNGLIHLSDANYRVQYHDVMYLEARGSKGNYIASVRSPKQGEKRQGVLVCTGNMAESATPDRSGHVRTERRNFTLVFEADERVKPIQIAPQAVKDYLDGLTPFQTEAPFDKQYGCLIEGRPVFYIPSQHDGMVYYFGHAPFSRIPAITADEDGKKRAVTPRDFIPAEVTDNPDHYDIAEAMFGYVDKGDKKALQGDKTRTCASRISVTDAQPADGQSDFYEAEFIPKILSGPKPTTFQHYLEQPNKEKTTKSDLKHYAHNPEDTRIRGHKLYWRQKGIKVNQIKEPNSISQSDTQHTRMRPIKPGVTFNFRVYFQNLSDVELGALAWGLTLPGSVEHRHQLGMGKPYGMGVVKLEAALCLSNREARYSSLFAEWDETISEVSPSGYIAQFEQYICSKIDHQGVYAAIPRIKELLTMLAVHQATGNAFQYMTIEPNNEYKDRPVLPYPSVVIDSSGKSEQASVTVHNTPQPQPKAPPLSVRKSVPGVGDEVKGKVFSVEGGLSFTPEGYEGYEAHIPKEKVLKRRNEGEIVKARVIEIRQGDPATLICEQIDPGEKKRRT